MNNSKIIDVCKKLKYFFKIKCIFNFSMVVLEALVMVVITDRHVNERLVIAIAEQISPLYL